VDALRDETNEQPPHDNIDGDDGRERVNGLAPHDRIDSQDGQNRANGIQSNDRRGVAGSDAAPHTPR
jgi:hypothetical protein